MFDRIESRHVLWWCSVVVVLTGSLCYALGYERFDEWTPLRPLSFFAMGIGMLGMVFLAPAWRSRSREILLLFGLALVVRIALLPTPASDDIHRYLWEGKLVEQGVSPYSHRGDSDELAQYRDKQWELMNNKDKLTAYPPGALLAFAVLDTVAYSPWSFKFGFVLADLMVVGILMAILSRRKRPLRHVVFYAFNPVTLVSFAGEAHFDVLMLVGLVTCGLLMDRKAWGWAGVALAVATQMKIIAVLGLPFLLWKGRWRAAGGFLLTGAALCLPFWTSLSQLVDGVYQFGAHRDFNGFPNLFGDAIGLTREQLHRPLQILFFVCVGWHWLYRRQRDDWHSYWLFISGSLLLLSPTIHFWYFTWIGVALVLAPSLFWVALTITQGVYFLVWKNYAETGAWDLKEVHSLLLWSPAFVLGVPYIIRFWQFVRARKPQKQAAQSDDDSVLVIIPTLNAADTIECCIDQVVLQGLRPQDMIVISDASSTDGTRKIAEREGIALVDACEGRGDQIAAGLALAPSRYVLIVHADTVLAEGSLSGMLAHMKQNPSCIGGCLGQRFTAQGLLPYRVVEALNEMRSTLWGVSFGDQCQFFDRTRFHDERFPDQPLMEDVELSMRLRSAGTVNYLAIESGSDPRKWRDKAPIRFALVIRLVATYYLQRVLGEERASRYSATLYRLYYGKPIEG